MVDITDRPYGQQAEQVGWVFYISVIKSQIPIFQMFFGSDNSKKDHILEEADFQFKQLVGLVKGLATNKREAYGLNSTSEQLKQLQLNNELLLEMETLSQVINE